MTCTISTAVSSKNQLPEVKESELSKERSKIVMQS